MSFLYSLITIVGIFTLLTLALNLEFGEGGIINFGLVAFFAIGAFSYAILTQPPPTEFDQYVVGFDLPVGIAAVAAIGVSVVLAWLTSWPVLRLRAEYLALAMFAFSQVLESLLINVRTLTSGTEGLRGIASPFDEFLPLADYDFWFMVSVVLLVVVVYLLMARLHGSAFGDALRAGRDDELAANALGKSIQGIRRQAFLLGAAVTALAGVMYASYLTVATPGLFSAEVTFVAFIALVIGGLGRPFGAVLGAIVFFGLDEALNQIPLSGTTASLVLDGQVIVFGLVLILLLRFAPQGLAGLIARDRRKVPIT